MRFPDLVLKLQSTRFRFNGEIELQDGIESVLVSAGYGYVREYSLGELGIIDFFLPQLRLGLEVKIKGDPVSVKRQLIRYAAAPEINELMLVTARTQLANINLEGTPFHPVKLTGSLL